MDNNKSYEILGVSPSASNEEIAQRYQTLKEKYQEDRFLEGEAGNDAARNLQNLEIAYADILRERQEQSKKKDDETVNSSTESLYIAVENAIKAGDLQKAQTLLDSFNERTAEWHYLQAVIFYKKNWLNESKKQLEFAIQKDSSNLKYKETYNSLMNKINNPQMQNPYGGYTETTRQMGGNDDANCCYNLLCAKCLLNCCCNCH